MAASSRAVDLVMVSPVSAWGSPAPSPSSPGPSKAISRYLESPLFSLPVGELSEIIEDDEGFHIIRVVERTPAHLVPFTEAQVEIKKSLQNQRRQKQVEEYVTNLRKTTPTWTIFDDQQGSRKLTERLGGSRPLPR